MLLAIKKNQCTLHWQVANQFLYQRHFLVQESDYEQSHGRQVIWELRGPTPRREFQVYAIVPVSEEIGSAISANRSNSGGGTTIVIVMLQSVPSSWLWVWFGMFR